MILFFELQGGKKSVGRGLDCLFASVLRYIPAKFVKIWRAIRSTLTGLANRNLKPQLPVANTITSKSAGARCQAPTEPVL